MKTIEPQKAKFVAEIDDVWELRLIGDADPDFWNRQLAVKSFRAFEREGSAEITIAATDLVWKSFRFRELTISLAIAAADDPQKQIGYYLLDAYNSNRFFAFCERTFFSTPYYAGKIEFQTAQPCFIEARADERKLLNAEMGGERAFVEEDERWQGAVFLPSPRGEKYFIAALSGTTKICRFAASDKIDFSRAAQREVFEQLIDSGFSGKEWRVREKAFHAKSRTYSLK